VIPDGVNSTAGNEVDPLQPPVGRARRRSQHLELVQRQPVLTLQRGAEAARSGEYAHQPDECLHGGAKNLLVNI
jgi:hypothetical protein